jgi:hypothetical protein
MLTHDFGHSPGAESCRKRYLQEIEGKVVPYADGREFPVIQPSKSTWVSTGKLRFGHDGYPMPGDGLDEWLMNHVIGDYLDDETIYPYQDDECFIEPELSETEEYHYIIDKKKDEWKFDIIWEATEEEVEVTIKKRNGGEELAYVRIGRYLPGGFGRKRDKVETEAHAVGVASYMAVMNGIDGKWVWVKGEQ